MSSALASQLRDLRSRNPAVLDKALGKGLGLAKQAFLPGNQFPTIHALYNAAILALEELEAMDSRFSFFMPERVEYDIDLFEQDEGEEKEKELTKKEFCLFSKQSLEIERERCVKELNSIIHRHVERFMNLIGSYLQLKCAQIAFEFLVRHFRIHLYDTFIVIDAFLPFHDSPIFQRLTSICVIPEVLELQDYSFLISSSRTVPLATELLVQYCFKRPSMLKKISELGTRPGASRNFVELYGKISGLVVQQCTQKYLKESAVATLFPDIIKTLKRDGVSEDLLRVTLNCLISIARKVTLSTALNSAILQAFSGKINRQELFQCLVEFVILQIEALDSAPKNLLESLRDNTSLAHILHSVDLSEKDVFAQFVLANSLNFFEEMESLIICLLDSQESDPECICELFRFMCITAQDNSAKDNILKSLVSNHSKHIESLILNPFCDSRLKDAYFEVMNASQAKGLQLSKAWVDLYHVLKRSPQLSDVETIMHQFLLNISICSPTSEVESLFNEFVRNVSRDVKYHQVLKVYLDENVSSMSKSASLYLVKLFLKNSIEEISHGIFLLSAFGQFKEANTLNDVSNTIAEEVLTLSDSSELLLYLLRGDSQKMFRFGLQVVEESFKRGLNISNFWSNILNEVKVSRYIDAVSYKFLLENISADSNTDDVVFCLNYYFQNISSLENEEIEISKSVLKHSDLSTILSHLWENFDVFSVSLIQFSLSALLHSENTFWDNHALSEFSSFLVLLLHPKAEIRSILIQLISHLMSLNLKSTAFSQVLAIFMENSSLILSSHKLDRSLMSFEFNAEQLRLILELALKCNKQSTSSFNNILRILALSKFSNVEDDLGMILNFSVKLIQERNIQQQEDSFRIIYDIVCQNPLNSYKKSCSKLLFEFFQVAWKLEYEYSNKQMAMFFKDSHPNYLKDLQSYAAKQSEIQDNAVLFRNITTVLRIVRLDGFHVLNYLDAQRNVLNPESFNRILEIFVGKPLSSIENAFEFVSGVFVNIEKHFSAEGEHIDLILLLNMIDSSEFGALCGNALSAKTVENWVTILISNHSDNTNFDLAYLLLLLCLSLVSLLTYMKSRSNILTDLIKTVSVNVYIVLCKGLSSQRSSEAKLSSSLFLQYCEFAKNHADISEERLIEDSVSDLSSTSKMFIRENSSISESDKQAYLIELFNLYSVAFGKSGFAKLALENLTNCKDDALEFEVNILSTVFQSCFDASAEVDIFTIMLKYSKSFEKEMKRKRNNSSEISLSKPVFGSRVFGFLIKYLQDSKMIDYIIHPELSSSLDSAALICAFSEMINASLLYLHYPIPEEKVLQSSLNTARVYATELVQFSINVLSVDQTISVIVPLLESFPSYRVDLYHLLLQKLSSQDMSCDIASGNLLEKAILEIIKENKSSVLEQQLLLFIIDVLLSKWNSKEFGFSAFVVDMLHTENVSVINSALISLSTCSTTFKLRFLSHFPKCINRIISIFETDASNSMRSGCFLALNSLLNDFAKFFTPFLPQIINLLFCRWSFEIEDTEKLLLSRFTENLANSINIEGLISSLLANYKDVIAKNPVGLCGMFLLLQKLLSRCSGADVEKHMKAFVKLFITSYDFNSSQRLELLHSEQIENSILEATKSYLLKLNAKQMKSFFLSVVEWVGIDFSSNVSLSRGAFLFNLCSAFTDLIGTLFIPYFSFVLDHVLAAISQKSYSNSFSLLFMVNCLSALRKIFQIDSERHFLQIAICEKLAPRIVEQMEFAKSASFEKCSSVATNYELFVSNVLIPCITDYAACVASEAQWKPLNHALLVNLQSSSSSVRYSSLLTLSELFRKLKEPYLEFLPEIIAAISEAMEDDDENVVRECRTLIKIIEDLAGESIQQYMK